MKIIVDMDIVNEVQVLGVHFIDVSPNAEPSIINPDDPSKRMRPLDALARFQEDPTRIVGSGWDILVSIPGVPEGTTRWDMLVNATQKANASKELVGLNLTAVPKGVL